jgi:hypothetical protein
MRQSTREEIASVDLGGHPAFTMGGVVPVKTVTDHWVTSQPNPDATDLDSLPWALAEALEGRDHHGEKVLPDHVGEVIDIAAAEANHPGSQPLVADRRPAGAGTAN